VGTQAVIGHQRFSENFSVIEIHQFTFIFTVRARISRRSRPCDGQNNPTGGEKTDAT